MFTCCNIRFIGLWIVHSFLELHSQYYLNVTPAEGIIIFVVKSL